MRLCQASHQDPPRWVSASCGPRERKLPCAACGRPGWRLNSFTFVLAGSSRLLCSADKMPFLLPSSLPRSFVFLAALVTLCSGEELQTSKTGSTSFNLVSTLNCRCRKTCRGYVIISITINNNVQFSWATFYGMSILFLKMWRVCVN